MVSVCGAQSLRCLLIYKNDTICHSLGCSGLVDRDSTFVIFKKLTKYMHPFFIDGHRFQLYLLPEPVTTLPLESEEIKLVRWDTVQIMETI